MSAEQDKLKAALAEIGANIDYPDEVEEEGVSARVGETLAEVGAFIDGLAATYFAGRKLTSGVVVGLVGRPNTGKSSILNSLLSYDKAIVSDVAGTTRDVVEGTLVINGVKFECKDTAGIRDSSDAVENIGIALFAPRARRGGRARRRAGRQRRSDERGRGNPGAYGGKNAYRRGE